MHLSSSEEDEEAGLGPGHRGVGQLGQEEARQQGADAPGTCGHGVRHRVRDHQPLPRLMALKAELTLAMVSGVCP